MQFCFGLNRKIVHAVVISNIIAWPFRGPLFPARSNSLERKIPRTKMGEQRDYGGLHSVIKAENELEAHSVLCSLAAESQKKKKRKKKAEFTEFTKGCF